MREGVPTFGDAVSAFLADLSLKGRSPRTRMAYGYLLKRLPVDESLALLTPAYVRNLIDVEIRAGRELATAGLLKTALGSLSTFCISQGWMLESPTKGISIGKGKEKPHRYLSAEEVKRVYEACLTDEMRLTVRLLMLGLRAAELLSLRWQDVNGDVLTVAFAKGGKVRRVVLDQETVRLLGAAGNQRAVVSTRSEVKHAVGGKTLAATGQVPRSPPDSLRRRTPPAAPTDDRILPLSYQALRLRLQTIGKRARVPGVRPHLFRHSMAVLSLKRGMEVTHLATLLGHADVQMITKVYARSIMEDAALDASRKLGGLLD